MEHTTPTQAAGPSGQLTLPAADAARLCGISRASWFKLRAADRVPAPIRLGGCVRWRVDELHAWLDAGAPPRPTWERMRGRPAAAGKGGGR